MSVAKDELTRMIQQQPEARSAQDIVHDLAVYAILNRNAPAAGGTQSQRWRWFLDVVFGAIVALGIQEYSKVVPGAWQQGGAALAMSLFIAFSACSFVVYDIAIFHELTIKYPYRTTLMGFIRFYLDLVMAFMLYLLLMSAFKPVPDWAAIAGPVSFWHLGAFAWHVTAQFEHHVSDAKPGAAFQHIVFIGTYWTVTGIVGVVGQQAFDLHGTPLDSLMLVTLCGTILVVSFYRWSYIIRKVL
jgi:hypothetical protein